jgi:iron complex outermembrane receptor protein
MVVCAASATAQTTEDLKRMSLEEIMQIEVTTASRVPEQTALVPAAIVVLTQDDIRRSGARSIPEVLRLAPGLQVARIGGGRWAIGSRGFADRLARSMLVLIDGRAVYSPLFAGTYWESQDTLLADVERIEIIRGPGGTLWGANAVNGIINIITKRAGDTQGLLLSAGGGSEERAFGGIRYGGRRKSVDYRAYAKAFDRGAGFHPDGNNFDTWRTGQAGFRADWTLKGNRTLTLQGDAYDGRLGERTTLTSYTKPFSTTSNVDAPIAGGNVMMHYSGHTGSRGVFQVQSYYDRTSRREIPVGETRDTFNLDFQDRIATANWNALTVGGGYRVTTGLIDAIAPSAVTPDRRTDNLIGAFVQDELTVVPNRWRLTFGSKLEHNDYSGFEVQPSARVLWTPQPLHTVFASVTRAVRTPSRVETDYTTAALTSESPTPTFVRVVPNPDFQSEKLIAFELGYRAQPIEGLYVTVSSFYNLLDDTLSTELLTPFAEANPAPAHVILPVQFANGLHGHSQGVELTADVRPTTWWRLTGGYSYLTVAMSRDPGGQDVSQERTYEGRIPHHQAQFGTSFNGPRSWSTDVFVRYVSRLSSVSVPAYTSPGFRVAYQVAPGLELALVGHDLASRHHLEWPSGTDGNIEVERSIYAQLTLRH